MHIYICVWLFKFISDHRRPRQYTTTAIYDMSPQLRLQCAQGRDFINTYAGTGVCVHTPIRLNPLASLAWLGKQAPCPLQKVEVFYLLRLHRLTRTRTRARARACKHSKRSICNAPWIFQAFQRLENSTRWCVPSLAQLSLEKTYSVKKQMFFNKQTAFSRRTCYLPRKRHHWPLHFIHDENSEQMSNSLTRN